MYMKMVIYQCFSLYFTTPALPYFIPINKKPKVPSFFIHEFYNETSIRNRNQYMNLTTIVITYFCCGRYP